LSKNVTAVSGAEKHWTRVRKGRSRRLEKLKCWTRRGFLVGTVRIGYEFPKTGEIDWVCLLIGFSGDSISILNGFSETVGLRDRSPQDNPKRSSGIAVGRHQLLGPPDLFNRPLDAESQGEIGCPSSLFWPWTCRRISELPFHYKTSPLSFVPDSTALVDFLQDGPVQV
jgi:hypothetical protein